MGIFGFLKGPKGDIGDTGPRGGIGPTGIAAETCDLACQVRVMEDLALKIKYEENNKFHFLLKEEINNKVENEFGNLVEAISDNKGLYDTLFSTVDANRGLHDTLFSTVTDLSSTVVTNKKAHDAQLLSEVNSIKNELLNTVVTNKKAHDKLSSTVAANKKAHDTQLRNEVDLTKSELFAKVVTNKEAHDKLSSTVTTNKKAHDTQLRNEVDSIKNELLKLGKKDIGIRTHIDNEISKLEKKDIGIRTHIDNEVLKLEKKDVGTRTHIDNLLDAQTWPHVYNNPNEGGKAWAYCGTQPRGQYYDSALSETGIEQVNHGIRQCLSGKNGQDQIATGCGNPLVKLCPSLRTQMAGFQGGQPRREDWGAW
jgi:hypothetical protein